MLFCESVQSANRTVSVCVVLRNALFDLKLLRGILVFSCLCAALLAGHWFVFYGVTRWRAAGCALLDVFYLVWPQVLSILGETFPAVAVYFLDVIVVKALAGLPWEVGRGPLYMGMSFFA